jgi:DNA modification methylase
VFISERLDMTRARRIASKKDPQQAASGAVVRPNIGQFTLLPTAALRPHPRNPRKHKREQIRAIARSIEAFGFNAPILVNKDMQIVAGHGRYEAARLLDYTEVPVVRLDHLSPEQASAYLLADNKLTDRSSWDDAALAVHLKELSELALDFDIEATGFELQEIDFRVQAIDDTDTAEKADEFAIAEGPAVSVLGDLWFLGPHRIHCGSAVESSAYSSLFDNEKAAATFTDPPYNVPINGHVSGKGKIKYREFPMASGEMSEAEFNSFLTVSLSLICAHTISGGLIYSCMDWRHMTPMNAAGRASGCDLMNLCVWAKSNGGLGSLYRSRHELIFVFRNGKSAHLNNVQLGRFGRNRTNVWNYAGVNTFGRKAAELHPTVKPIRMVADAILDSTKRDDIVLDPFLGSGTTLLAAERTNRRGYGIELDPLYVDTSVERWQRMTGRKAHNRLGETFDFIRSRRGTNP